MHRKRLFYIVTAILVGAFVIWALILAQTGRSSKPIAFSELLASQISVSMTRSDVETILGGPPGDYTTGPCDEPASDRYTFVCDWWESDTGLIGVWFDEEGNVREVVFHLIHRVRQPFWYEALTGFKSLRGNTRPPKTEPYRTSQQKWADFVKAHGGRVEKADAR